MNTLSGTVRNYVLHSPSQLLHAATVACVRGCRLRPNESWKGSRRSWSSAAKKEDWSSERGKEQKSGHRFRTWYQRASTWFRNDSGKNQVRYKEAEILPFRISRQQALDHACAFFKQQWLAPRALKTGSTVTSVKGHFVPYYAYDVTTRSSYTASVGKRTHDVPHQEDVLEYTPVWGHAVGQRYEPHEEDLQVYAGHTFKRDLVAAAKHPLTGLHSMSSLPPHALQGKEMHRFEKYATTARTVVVERIAKRERARIEELLLHKHEADAVKDLFVKSKLSYVYHTVYFPVYAIEYTRFGHPFRLFVNGCTGRVAGQYHYSIPATTALGCVVGLFLSGGASLQFQLGSVGASLLAGAVAGGLPFVRQLQRERRRLLELDEHDRYNELGDDRDDRQAHKRYNDRLNEERKKYREDQSHDWCNPEDVDGAQLPRHYRTLGVGLHADLADIKAAFRSKAFEYHPDKHKGAEAKKQANAQFRTVLEAYQTLRDPAKRALYDAQTGYR